MLTPSIGLCLMPLTMSGRLNAGSFENGGNDVDDVMELHANSTDVRDVAGPGNGHALSGSAEVRRDLLGPLERGIESPRPRHRHVGIGFVRSPLVVVRQLQGFRNIHDAVVGGHLVVGADKLPSGLVPLSPLMKMISVLSSLPMSCTS